MGVELTLPSGNLKLYNIYSPPEKSLELDSLNCEKENWMIIGDFNSHSPSWGYPTIDDKEKTWRLGWLTKDSFSSTDPMIPQHIP